eukprot:TRINITY_DN66893_c6_g4_i1.p1 TRINITY_DN66893_c6_g4~~TRINITY_DN66893_c6_g4_i1.p1  ORF type:complete len:374 (+),score=71.28 TRINITY_DN66893_c6_g4_i1:68-1189(+)
MASTLVNPKDVFLVGMEFYLFSEDKKQRTCVYPTAFKRDWDYSHIEGIVSAALEGNNKTAYIFGTTEGFDTSGMGDIIPVPTLNCFITAGQWEAKFGYVMQGKEVFKSLTDFKCEWKSSESNKRVQYLSSSYIPALLGGDDVDKMGLDTMSEEELAPFQFANLYIEPEKRTVDQDSTADDEFCVLVIPCSTGAQGFNVEFDIREKVTIEQATDNAMKENELPADCRQELLETISKPVKERREQLAQELERRKKMSDDEKQTWRDSKLIKFYPSTIQKDGIRTVQFVNRYFGKAEEVNPTYKKTFGFGGGFGGGFFKQPAAAPAPAAEAPKADPQPESTEAKTSKRKRSPSPVDDKDKSDDEQPAKKQQKKKKD